MAQAMLNEKDVVYTLSDIVSVYVEKVSRSVCFLQTPLNDTLEPTQVMFSYPNWRNLSKVFKPVQEFVQGDALNLPPQKYHPNTKYFHCTRQGNQSGGEALVHLETYSTRGNLMKQYSIVLNIAEWNNLKDIYPKLDDEVSNQCFYPVHKQPKAPTLKVYFWKVTPKSGVCIVSLKKFFCSKDATDDFVASFPYNNTGEMEVAQEDMKCFQETELLEKVFIELTLMYIKARKNGNAVKLVDEMSPFLQDCKDFINANTVSRVLAQVWSYMEIAPPKKLSLEENFVDEVLGKIKQRGKIEEMVQDVLLYGDYQVERKLIHKVLDQCQDEILAEIDCIKIESYPQAQPEMMSGYSDEE